MTPPILNNDDSLFRSGRVIQAKEFPIWLRNLVARCEVVPNREFLNWYSETIYRLLNNGPALPPQPPKKELDKVKEPPQQVQEPGA